MQVAVPTSGGDATGTNTAVRAVARTAFPRRLEVAGVEAGYRRLLEACYPADYGKVARRRS